MQLTDPSPLEKWWTSQDWGTVPDWFAAVGTVGTLVLGLVILLLDKRSRSRIEANQFITTVFTSITHKPTMVTEYKVELTALNAGTTPIHAPTIHTPKSYGGPYQYEFIKGSKSRFQFMPSDTEAISLDYGEVFPDLKLLFVRFRDSQGRQFHRNVDSGKYVSQRRYNRVMDPYRHRIKRVLRAAKTRVASAAMAVARWVRALGRGLAAGVLRLVRLVVAWIGRMAARMRRTRRP